MPDDLINYREALVRHHMRCEEAGQYERALATFYHPRYEIVGTGEVHDGEYAVRQFYADGQQFLPEIRYENTTLRHAGDAVLVETVCVGQHLGRLRGLPATGRSVRIPMCNIFEFDGRRLMCERTYFDLHSMLAQIGFAPDHKTVHGRLSMVASYPLTLLRALWRSRL